MSIFSRVCRSWRLSSLVILFAVVLSAGVTANEPSVWQREIETLKTNLLYSLECFNEISRLASEQSTKHDEALLLLAEQKKLLDSSQKRIDYLLSQIATSQDFSVALLKELAALQDLQNQAQQQSEKVSAAYAAYRKEAEKQIREIQGERDRARAWIHRLAWVIVAALGGGFALGAWVF